MDPLQTTTAGHSEGRDGWFMGWFQRAAALTAVVNVAPGVAALAQQPPRPLARVSGCPLDWFSSGCYSVNNH